MTLPNFIILGAAKAGTTSLYRYLCQHPQIYMSPVKETNFFSLEGHRLDFSGPGDREHIGSFAITEFEAYQALFQAVASERAIGEASPMYLYSRRAPANLARRLPQVKLIAMLRDPAERAFSQYVYFVRDRREPLTDFREALEQCEPRRQSGWEWAWQYVEVGFYGRQLSRYWEMFDARQIRVYLYRDFCHRPDEILRDIYRFLDVDETFAPDVSTRHNVSTLPRSRRLAALCTNPHPAKSLLKQALPERLRQRLKATVTKYNSVRPQLSDEMREYLIEIYREDVLKLQDLIDRDLSHWLRKPR